MEQFANFIFEHHAALVTLVFVGLALFVALRDHHRDHESVEGPVVPVVKVEPIPTEAAPKPADPATAKPEGDEHAVENVGRPEAHQEGEKLNS